MRPSLIYTSVTILASRQHQLAMAMSALMEKCLPCNQDNLQDWSTHTSSSLWESSCMQFWKLGLWFGYCIMQYLQKLTYSYGHVKYVCMQTWQVFGSKKSLTSLQTLAVFAPSFLLISSSASLVWLTSAKIAAPMAAGSWHLWSTIIKSATYIINIKNGGVFLGNKPYQPCHWC